MKSSRSMKIAAALLAAGALIGTISEASAARVHNYGYHGGYYHGGGYHGGGYYRGGNAIGGLVAGTALGVIGAATAGIAADHYYNGYPAYTYQPGYYGYQYGYDYHPGYGYYGPY